MKNLCSPFLKTHKKMKHFFLHTLITAWALCLSLAASAQMTLTRNGTHACTIYIVSADTASMRAARLLNHFVGLISGATLPVSTATPTSKGAIVIGGHTPKAGTDGYAMACTNDRITIESGGGSGVVYGVAALVERYMGVNYWAAGACDYTPRATIEVPAFSHAETPAFHFRQTYNYNVDDPIYRDWYAIENQSQMFAGNLWVHTFNRLLPAEVYGKSHPEYYSMINGRRQPGDHSQWCLTNPEVLRMAVHKIDSVFKAHPGMNMISVSQNDGNGTYCQCPRCQEVDREEGSPSGNYIRFMNELARRFPDKQISTLAYLFTMQPPRKTKPLPNVNIMLCNIDCKREVPLTDNASGREFVKALEGWAHISNNIFIWDYGINFDNYIAPFPNFHIIQPNLQLFKQHHATMVFEQANGPKGTDMGELRSYMMAKLMWNPQADADSLMNTFLKGYYGAAAPYLYQYIKIMQGALLASNIPLWIYDSPISHKNGMLNRNLMKTYNALFDKAEAAVAADKEKLERVRLARLPLQYSALEIARTRNDSYAEKEHLLFLFSRRTQEYGVKYLNENQNTTADFCEIYFNRFLFREQNNKALGAKVTWILPPSDKYRTLGETALTDGLYGGASYVESWVGWEGKDAEFVLDMGQSKTFETLNTDVLFQNGAWILLPKDVQYSTSEDGQNFTPFGTFTFTEDRRRAIRFVGAKVEKERPVSARYIKVRINGIGNCPAWHYGVGHPAWFFIDEVTAE